MVQQAPTQQYLFGIPLPSRKMMQWILTFTLWFVGAHIVHSIDPAHATLYACVSVLIFVFRNLSGRRRPADEMSPYGIQNKDGRRMDGDITAASFGIPGLRNAPNYAQQYRAAGGGGHRLGSGGVGGGTTTYTCSDDGESVSSEALAAFNQCQITPGGTLDKHITRLLPVMHSDIGLVQEYFYSLSTAKKNTKLHAKCPCGNPQGLKFGQCCSDLQVFLRVSRYGQ